MCTMPLHSTGECLARRLPASRVHGGSGYAVQLRITDAMSPLAWLLAMQGASQPQRCAEAGVCEEPGGTHWLASAWLRADALWPGPQLPAARVGVTSEAVA